jgi:predicted nuclease of predicted toxin-antitoxin system
MRWLADECVHAPIVANLRTEGHDVVYAAETARQTPDINLADQARRSRRILLTEDKDFGDLAYGKRRPIPGTVLLRFPTEHRSLKWPALKVAIERYGEALYRSFTVIDKSRIRSQPLAADDMRA